MNLTQYELDLINRFKYIDVQLYKWLLEYAKTNSNNINKYFLESLLESKYESNAFK